MNSSLIILEEIAEKNSNIINNLWNENQRLREENSKLILNQEKIEKTIKKITKSFQSDYNSNVSKTANNILTPTAIPRDGLGELYIRRDTA